MWREWPVLETRATLADESGGRETKPLNRGTPVPRKLISHDGVVVDVETGGGGAERWKRSSSAAASRKSLPLIPQRPIPSRSRNAFSLYGGFYYVYRFAGKWRRSGRSFVRDDPPGDDASPNCLSG
ncbi:hypothetical protein GWI33_018944 [Rhynchophorus ferrugineus]|uniref:Uncharacterized protein n=1 Tax=Rhynchophorus ferrugineus TaxID=354439 RepID=A0A834HVX5_RHYFE|nr:hypothetical protein GWI33_018944 [Rhynchophorus ferrugineus]